MASHKKQQSRARLAMAKQGARVGTPAEPTADEEFKTDSTTADGTTASSGPSGGDTNTADNVTEKKVGMSDSRPRTYGPDDYVFNDDTDVTGAIPPMSSQLPEPYHFDPGFHMSSRRDPNDLSGRTNFRGTRGTRFSSAHEAAADQLRRKISPYYAPVTLRGPSGEAIRCLALVDTGSEETFITPALAHRIKATSTIIEGREFYMADASKGLVQLRLTDEAVRFWCGDKFRTDMHVGVLDLNEYESPYVLLGRRFLEDAGMFISNIPFKYPQPSSETDPDFLDVNERVSKRLSDPRVLSPQDELARESLRESMDSLLRLHAAAVPVNSFITHPEAPVHVLHDVGAECTYICHPRPPPI
jgi:hypothetical protein